ncbi:MAG: hypothetical protein KAJ17_02840, partial [Candidatus Krumholzibacteria bacterium]|nr:hypothetical protein [Candidatus Krumholzibacteria bacterium]
RSLGHEPISRDGLEREVTQTMKHFDMATMRNPDKTPNHLMGILMDKLIGRAEGRRVARFLESALSSTKEA